MKITYLLTNLITGDEYVGVTADKLGLKQRLTHHKSRAKRGTHNHLPLYQNINQYGWENFHSKVLCEGDDESYYVWLLQASLNLCWNNRTCPDNVKEAIKEANSKAVVCVETGVVYPSATEADNNTPANYAAISRCCSGKQKTAGGFHWRFSK